jgi:hypothetical protein
MRSSGQGRVGFGFVEEDTDHVHMGDARQCEESADGVDVFLEGRGVEHGRDAKGDGVAERERGPAGEGFDCALGGEGARVEPEQEGADGHEERLHLVEDEFKSEVSFFLE